MTSTPPSSVPLRAPATSPAASAAGAVPFPTPLLLALVALALLCRFSGLGNGFVNYDDDRLRAELATKGPWEILTGPFYYAYKPVYGLWLWTERALFGDAARPGLVASWLLFGAAVGLLAVVLHRMLGSLFLAGVGAALLATHPVHAENVAWWSERKDVLSLVLVLLAHLAHQRARTADPTRTPWAPAVLLLLAGLTKGTAWTYAGVIAVDEALHAARAPGRLRRLAPLLVVAVLGVALDAWSSARLGPGAVRYDATFGELAAAMAGVHGRYLRTLLWPFGFAADYPVDPVGSWADPYAWAGVALALAAVGGLVVGVARRNAALAAGCGLWILGLAPVNNLWPTTSILRSDRYLLVPAVGLYVLFGAALLRWRSARVAAVVVAAGVLGVLAHARGPVWADSETLWTDTLTHQPGSAIAALNRAVDRQERRRFVDAEADARRAVASATAVGRPELVAQARVLLSTSVAAQALLRRDTDPDGARRRADDAVRLAIESLDDAEAAARAGGPLERDELRGRAKGAVANALETRAQLPGDPRDRDADFRAATTAWQEATALAPRLHEAWWHLGQLLLTTGGPAKSGEAAVALARALDLRPDDVETVGMLVVALTNAGRDVQAQAVLEDARSRLGSPRALRVVELRIAMSRDDVVRAARQYEGLVREQPGDDEVRALYGGFRRRRAETAAAAARLSRDPADFQAALLEYEQALAAVGRDPDVHLGAGDVLLMLSRFRDARLRYGQARAAARGAAWIKNLEARAGLLEAVVEEEAGRPEAAARVVAEVLRLEPPRLDVGFLVLDEEARRARPAAEAVLGEAGPDLAAAQALLRGLALVVAGDETAGAARLNEAVARAGTSVPPGSRTAQIVDAARVLRALVSGRHADLAGARRELDALAARDPADPLVAYHRLLVDRTEATARARIAAATDDAAALAAAQASLADVAARARALADRPDLPWAGPALLAAELDLERGESTAVLGRLNTAATRFPDVPSVRRGKAAVYQAMMIAGGERTTLLREAQRELTEAQRVDRRDPRTALDLSQLYRLAGDLDAAAKHAVSAASVEPVRGPASRALAAILVEQGRKALDANAWDRATGLAAAASKADPRAAAADLLAGDVANARQDLNAALAAYARAHEKSPADPGIRAALAACHRQRGAAFFLAQQMRPRPKAAADGTPPDPAKLAAYDAWFEKNVRGAAGEYRQAVELEPDGPFADDDREKLAHLRGLDPATSGASLAAARALFEQGEALRRDARPEEALVRYQEAAVAYPEFVFAWLRIAELAAQLGRDHDLVGIQAVDRLRALDRERAYPEVDLYAAEILVRIGREAAGDAARKDVVAAAAAQARVALERFVAALEAVPKPTEREAASLARAQVLRTQLASPLTPFPAPTGPAIPNTLPPPDVPRGPVAPGTPRDSAAPGGPGSPDGDPTAPAPPRDAPPGAPTDGVR